ncbi:MAG: hypothetical protein IJ324_10800, partial [Lachnospiraceae bacterium]|nr:hypothetical protein [Lachnospiraceae bacterium]
FSHASEYVIIIDDNAMETPDSDGVTAPETSDIDNTWKACWLLACGVIALIAAFFVKKYKKA